MENKKQGYKVRKYQGPVKRYCQMLNLKNDAALIAEYRKRHSEGKVWPETLAAIREVGILEMEIYILGTNLFEQDGDILYPYQLSSGEKQILVILLTVLVQDNRRGVLFMDEPEVSLHVEWQQRLISLIRQLNPNVQIVLTTHSPAVIMDGWLDAVTEVSDITK